MNTSLLYHAFGVREQECLGINYEDNSIIIKIQTRSDKLRCPCCGSRHFIRRGVCFRTFHCVPIGSKQVKLSMQVQRIQCKECHNTRQENIHFVTGKRAYTNKLARLVVTLSRIGTIKDIANFLHLSWDTVKDIQKRYLIQHYSNPDISKVKRIGIDEFAVAKGHVYKTIVVDLDTGQVIHIGDGKGGEALAPFWKKVKKKKVKIEAVATDLSPAFISSVMSNAPEAALIFDHFHVVKLLNDTIDEIRRDTYKMETDLNKRKVLKGTRWLLLCNEKDIFDTKYRTRLDNALAMNKDLFIAYYLKEDLKEIWDQLDKEQAGRVLDLWIQQAKDSKQKLLIKFANTLAAHRTGILAWYDHCISTGKVEGINNKIKTMKRQAYGYRDSRFFELKILAMHEDKYAFIG